MKWWPMRGRRNRSGGPPAASRSLDVAPDGTLSLSPSLLAEMQAGAQAGDPEAMANFGAYLLQQGRLAEAIEWTECAWQQGYLDAGFNLGTMYAEAGDTHRADLVWTRVAQLGDPDAMMCLARLALRRGDRSTADRWLEPVLGQDQPYPITALGVAYRDSGDLDTALRVLDRAIILGDGYAMEYAARIHQQRGDIDTATRLLAQAAGSTRYGWGPIERS